MLARYGHGAWRQSANGVDIPSGAIPACAPLKGGKAATARLGNAGAEAGVTAPNGADVAPIAACGHRHNGTTSAHAPPMPPPRGRSPTAERTPSLGPELFKSPLVILPRELKLVRIGLPEADRSAKGSARTLESAFGMQQLRVHRENLDARLGEPGSPYIPTSYSVECEPVSLFPDTVSVVFRMRQNRSQGFCEGFWAS